MHEDTQRNRNGSSRDEMPLWMRQVMDAFDSGERKYGKLAKTAQQNDKGKKISVAGKTERLDKLLQEKGADLAPRGEWGKFISWLIKEHIGNFAPQQSAIFAFTAGYTWQKDRKNWVSRNIDNLQGNSDRVIRLAADLRRQIAYHYYCYNVLNWPEISDHDYDALVQNLQNLENKHPELKQPATVARCTTKWLYEVEKLLEVNFAGKGELRQSKTVKRRGGKLDQGLLQRFMDAIPDDPIEVVPDEEWQNAFSAFFERHFQEHTMLTACRAAFVAGAAWHKFRDILDG